MVLAALAASLAGFGCSSDESGSASDGGPTDGAAKEGSTTGADGGWSGDGAPQLKNLASLEVTPANKTLSLSGKPQTVQYTATATLSDKSTRDVTKLVRWRVDNSEPGAIDKVGLYTANGGRGGKVIITADALDSSGKLIAGTATLTITVTHQIVDTGAPKNAKKLFDPTKTRDSSSAKKQPELVYPSDETMFPRNIYKILFQWRKGDGNTLFHLTFASARGKIHVYTKGDACPKAGNTKTDDCIKVDADGACWKPTKTQWDWIAGTNAGSSVTWSVEALNTASPTKIYSGKATQTINFSKSVVRGAIFYWSTTVQGIRRATITSAKPENFLTPATPYPTTSKPLKECVACHTVSRNGKKIAATVGKGVGVFDVKKRYPALVNFNTSNDKPVLWEKNTWSTFNADTSLIVSSHKGVLTLRDGTTGVPKSTLTIGSGSQSYATMPDWAPDESLLVFTRSSVDKDRGVDESSIATLAYSAKTFAKSAKTLVQGSATQTNAFPMFSPDSQWIAFSRAKDKSDKDKTAEIWVVDRDGKRKPVRLAVADTVVNSKAKTDLQNNMPTWAPKSKGSKVLWVAFSSLRTYGVVDDGGKLQIWVAAVDPAKAKAGTDPTWPAFRLPFQDHCENVHRPFWAEDVNNPPPGADGGTGPVDAGPLPPVDGGGPSCLPKGSSCAGSTASCCQNLCCREAPDGGSYTCQACPIL